MTFQASCRSFIHLYRSVCLLCITSCVQHTSLNEPLSYWIYWSIYTCFCHVGQSLEISAELLTIGSEAMRLHVKTIQARASGVLNVGVRVRAGALIKFTCSASILLLFALINKSVCHKSEKRHKQKEVSLR